MISLLSTIGLGLLILAGIAAILGIFLDKAKLIIGSLIVFGIIFAAYFLAMPELVFMGQ